MSVNYVVLLAVKGWTRQDEVENTVDEEQW